MALTIAMTGKGGVGKTTLSALTTNWLLARGETPILLVDADSNANLAEALGISYEQTVGGVRESARKEAQALKGISKQEFLNLRIQEALVEQRGYDMIVMGRPEGPGCYCFANNILRDVLQKLAGNYRHILVDSEAGLEHISRRTMLTIDYLFIVSDCTVRGVRTAGRIAELADEVGASGRFRGLIVNRVPDGPLPPAIEQAAATTGLDLVATIPLDQNVAAMDAGGMAVGDIPAASPARQAVNQLMEEIFSKELADESLPQSHSHAPG